MKWFYLVLVALSAPPSLALAQGEVADEKTIERIIQQINLVPSLHARHQGQPNLKGMPKYLAKKLAPYALDDMQSVDKERRRWQLDRDQYERDHPLRAATFETMVEMESVQKLELRVVLLGGPITPKVKATMLQEQAPIGMAIFKLEQILVQMRDVGEKRQQEKSRVWLANYDFALARLEANLVFLYEYNFTLGTIRADNLPPLRAGDAGWRITSHPNLHITEAKAKQFAQDRARRLRAFREEHAGTPWAFFADIEAGRLLGMEWTPAKE